MFVETRKATLACGYLVSLLDCIGSNSRGQVSVEEFVGDGKAGRSADGCHVGR